MDVDVAIVGAGPTGLLAAGLLVRAGVSVRILDASPHAAKESRAFVVQARTLEILLSIGLADAFMDRGVPATGARMHVDGRPVAGLNFENLGRTDTPYPIVLMIPQADTEAILAADLASRGVAVERGLTATALTQDADGVDLRGRYADGREVALRASYLVGADGAHSFVRKALGLSFEGAPYAQTFLLADCTVDGPIAEAPFSVFFHEADFAIWFPLKGGRTGRVITTSRVASVDPSIAAQGSAPATLPEVEDAFRRAAQLDLRLRDPVWLSRYRVHHRGVDRYGAGRAFVAGDAAHIHSPAGGQGMNTGLQDAANLAWKLAVAVKGCPPAGLLGSYDGERRPVGNAVLAATDRVFSIATSPSRWVAALRRTILPIAGFGMRRSEALRSRAFHLLSELASATNRGRLSRPRPPAGRPGSLPGGARRMRRSPERCPCSISWPATDPTCWLCRAARSARLRSTASWPIWKLPGTTPGSGLPRT